MAPCWAAEHLRLVPMLDLFCDEAWRRRREQTTTPNSVLSVCACCWLERYCACAGGAAFYSRRDLNYTLNSRTFVTSWLRSKLTA